MLIELPLIYVADEFQIQSITSHEHIAVRTSEVGCIPTSITVLAN